MFSRPFVRTILTAALAAILLVPAAQADDWGRDKAAHLDPAIAAAIHDRASAVVESSAARPDDRPGAHGVGSLPQTEQAPAGRTFDWSSVGVGAGATIATLLLALGSLLAVRHGRARVKSA